SSLDRGLMQQHGSYGSGKASVRERRHQAVRREIMIWIFAQDTREIPNRLLAFVASEKLFGELDPVPLERRLRGLLGSVDSKESDRDTRNYNQEENERNHA